MRFLYAYPNKVTQKLLDTIAEYPALVKYIDMPLQHASPAVLKRMKRGGSGDIFLKLIERMRRTIPGVAIRTSFIVGFPGETDADFEELCAFVRRGATRPRGRIRLLGRRHQRELCAGRQGGRPHHLQPQAAVDGGAAQNLPRAQPQAGGRPRCRCWWKASRPKRTCSGRAAWPRQAPEIDGVTLINDVEGAPPAPGQIRMLRITEAHDYDLVGTLLPAATEEAVPLPTSPLVMITPAPDPQPPSPAL